MCFYFILFYNGQYWVVVWTGRSKCLQDEAEAGILVFSKWDKAPRNNTCLSWRNKAVVDDNNNQWEVIEERNVLL